MNGFEQHGLAHLSPSSLNLWINAPDVWIAEKLMKRRGAASPAMHRGNAVEGGVGLALRGESLEAATTKALEAFDRAVLFGDERSAKERDAIPGMIAHAVEALAPFGRPDDDPESDRGQHKISLTARGENWEIPVIGFLDFQWSARGLVVDTKTTFRMPTTMTPEHQTQRAVYAKAMNNYAVRFLYATPKKAEFREDGEAREILPAIKMHITRLERFLRGRTAEEITAIVPVNPNSFYWRGNEETRREIYGL